MYENCYCDFVFASTENIAEKTGFLSMTRYGKGTLFSF